MFAAPCDSSTITDCLCLQHLVIALPFPCYSLFMFAASCDSSAVTLLDPSLRPGLPDGFLDCHFIHDVDSLAPCDGYSVTVWGEGPGELLHLQSTAAHTRGANSVEFNIADLAPFPKKVSLTIDITEFPYGLGWVVVGD